MNFHRHFLLFDDYVTAHDIFSVSSPLLFGDWIKEIIKCENDTRESVAMWRKLRMDIYNRRYCTVAWTEHTRLNRNESFAHHFAANMFVNCACHVPLRTAWICVCRFKITISGLWSIICTIVIYLLLEFNYSMRRTMGDSMLSLLNHVVLLLSIFSLS